MPLAKLTNYALHYGTQIIFDDIELQLEAGDRLCITGRNGAGKSTLLKCLEGTVDPDSGSRWVDPAIKIASLSQDLPEANDTSVFDFVAAGLGGLQSYLQRFYDLTQDHSESALKELEELQHLIEAADGWNMENNINAILSRLDLDGEKKMSALSGGWRRRVALAQALASSPDILLLDEPTNHLDIGAIAWLEKFLASFAGAVVFITHDRTFLRVVANKVGELDRGVLTIWDGNYDSFLAFREQKLREEERQNALFDKKLAQEEVWIRQGIKARRTRNEGRVRALKKMRDEHAQRRNKQKTAVIEHGTDSISGKLVAELADVSFAWQDKKIVNKFSTSIIRGDKIGLVGPNGYGKSTLLKLILGELEPSHGKVKQGTKLSIAYFDQLRDQLDVEKSAIDNIAEGRDSIEINGKTKHAMSYLQDFMFSGERARTPIKSLSGGERNRILLAKLFSKPSNLLVMDEPTNDLDAETLELLEELLASFEGTLLLVSHDREFLDNVVTSTIVFEGDGVIKEYVGGYHDWIRQGGKWPENQGLKATSVSLEENVATSGIAESNSEPEQKKKKKLSYKLQRELEELPQKLENLEGEIAKIQEEIASPDFYSQDQSVVTKRLDGMASLEQNLQQLYDRWEELGNL